MEHTSVLERVLRGIALTLVVVFFMFPIFWIVLMSLQTNETILRIPPSVVFEPTLQNYRALLTGRLETVTGTLDIAAPNLSELSALALTELDGALSGTLALTGTGAAQRAELTLAGEDLSVAGTRISRLSASGTASGDLTAPTLSGEARLSGILAGDTLIETVTATATSQGTRTDLRLDARLAQGSNADGVALIVEGLGPVVSRFLQTVEEDTGS